MSANYNEELKYYKREKDRINAEINDLESRIVVESGRQHRYEVNNYRDRVNRLKMRLNEISLEIVELEKMVNIERKIKYRNNQPVSVSETFDEIVTTRRLSGRNNGFIETLIID